MHTTIDYSSLSLADGDAAALNHFAQHLGTPRWETLLTAAKQGTFPSKDYFRDLASVMLEVEGRPVEAFIRTYLSDLPDRADIDLFVKVEETTRCEPRAANPES